MFENWKRKFISKVKVTVYLMANKEERKIDKESTRMGRRPMAKCIWQTRIIPINNNNNSIVIGSATPKVKETPKKKPEKRA